MAYHLYGVGTNTGNLGKMNKGGWHLVYGENIVLLSPKDYLAYEVGLYNQYQCYQGFTSGGIATIKQTETIKVINDGQNNVTANDGRGSGVWWHGLHEPNFVSCIGSSMLGCASWNHVDQMSYNAGCYMMIPMLMFELPSGHTAKRARIRFKGYSEAVTCSQNIASGTDKSDRWAVPMKTWRKGSSGFASGTTPYSPTSGNTKFVSTMPEMLFAWASPYSDEFRIRQMFYTKFANNQDQSSWLQYDLLLNGSTSAGSHKNFRTYVNGMINMNKNGLFCGACGGNGYRNAGSSQDWDYAYPYMDGNDGTWTHKNCRFGGDWGENFGDYGGTVFKQVGGHFYADNMLNSTARGDSSWLVTPYIQLQEWQLRALNEHGFIWIVYANPCPWFCTTDKPSHMGGSKQVYVEGCKLEVQLDD